MEPEAATHEEKPAEIPIVEEAAPVQEKIEIVTTAPVQQVVVTEPELMKEGDAVIVYEEVSRMDLIRLKLGAQLSNKYGTFRHEDFIGRPFGSKITSKNGRGFIYALKPTATLITASIPHRTQILYDGDIATILLQLDVQPGATVLESGTGSGSLSFGIASAVGTKGKLVTYEFNKERAEKARELFALLGLSQVSVVWRDACSVGFRPSPEEAKRAEEGEFELPDRVDAVFLDLPKPWEALPHARAVIRAGGRVCCFSPCIEQVQRNVEKLEELGFREVRTFEVLLRHLEKKTKIWRSLDHYESKLLSKRRRPDEPQTQAPSDIVKAIHVSQGPVVGRGHTGYLTFGRLQF